jgi:hypothetical protein|tara:strand:+ start:307 stop:747 length:441 start_codon:yes stop_codon:yes gene_type:complete
MTIKELNKLIKEELDAYLNEEQTDEMYKPMEDGDDIEVTTDEPEEGGEDEALDTLRQIFNMLKPIVEPEEEVSDEEVEDLEGGEDEVEDEVGDDEEGEEVDEAVGYPNYRADQVSKVKADATDVNQGLNESFNGAARFKKLANIIK